MARKEFVTAAKNADAEDKGEAPEPFEFGLAGQDFKTQKMPTSAQLSLLSIGLNQGDKEAIETALDIFDGILEGNGGRRLRRLLARGVVTPGLLFFGDELNEEGIIAALMEHLTGRPTTPSSASSESPKSAGRRSTGRAPAKKSTPGDSPSTDS